MLENQTHVGRLHVRGAGQDGPAVRLTLERLLGSAELRPPGLAPAAILCVHRLTDPLPGRLSIRAPVLRPAPDWEQAVRHSLEALCRSAARPAGGLLPGDPEAVLFADEGEMLACLALDLARGEADRRWWWRTPLRALRPFRPEERLYRLLAERVRFTPAALDHLAGWQRAEAVVQELSPEQALALLSALLHESGHAGVEPSPAFWSSPAGPEARPYGSAPVTRREHGLPAGPLVQEETGDRDVDPPWAGWLPVEPVVPLLGRPRAALVGTALLLHRSPGRVRAAGFVPSLQRWWAAVEQGGREPAPPAPAPGLRLQGFRPGAPGRALLDGAGRGAAESGAHQGAEGGSDPSFAGDAPDASGAGIGARRAERTEPLSPCATPLPGAAGPGREGREARDAGPGAGGGGAGTSSEAHRQEAGRGGAHPAEAAPEVLAPGGPALRAFAGGVDTELGGVLYLVNLMTAMGLPDLFEADWRLGSRVGAWGTLELIARGLLAPVSGAWPHDPIWRALALLDGRAPGTPPGLALEGRDRFRFPPDWLPHAAGAPPFTVCWACRAGRLRIWTAEHGLLAELPETGAPLAQVRAVLQDLDLPAEHVLLQSCSPDEERAGLTGDEEGGPVGRGATGGARWAAYVLPFLRRRLQAALGLEPGDPAALSEVLLRHPGRLFVTSSHVDLVLSLERVSLPVRTAGLDRDPGWVPSFGRVILFHYR